MALGLAEKQAIVADLAQVAERSISVVAADYRGLTVGEMTDLRVKAREKDVHVGVYRNTLARRAVEGTGFACMQEALVGPLALFFSDSEPGAPAKLLKDFAKDNDKLVVQALVVDGQLLPADQLDTIAKLPSRDEALATLMSVLQAPVTKLVRTQKELVAQVVRVTAAVRDQKDAA